MIIIRFQKKPKSPQREMAIEMGMKYKYNDDGSFFEISLDKLEDAYKIIDEAFNGCSAGLKVFIGSHLVNPYYVSHLYECIKNKKPFTSLDWFEEKDNKFLYSNDIREFSNKINQINNSKISEVRVDLLDTIGLNPFFEVIDYNKKYNIKKGDLIKFFEEQAKIIQEVFPQFSQEELTKIINSLPNEISIKEESEEVEGEEWVDWVNDANWKIEVRRLLIEINQKLSKS